MPAKKPATSRKAKTEREKHTEAADGPRLSAADQRRIAFSDLPTWHQRINRVLFQLNGLAMRVNAIESFFGELEHFRNGDLPNESEVFGLSAMASEAAERLEKIKGDLDILSDMSFPETCAYSIAELMPRTA